MIDAARASARTLAEAGVEPESPAHLLSGWLVLQRLDRTEIAEPDASGAVRQERSYYEQIWLTPAGELRCASRCHAVLRAPDGTVYPDTDRTDAGAEITAPQDIADARWEGATRITAALDAMTPWLLERRRDAGAPASTRLGGLEAMVRSGVRPEISGTARAVAWGLLILTLAWPLWAIADFTAAFSTLLWATPLVLLVMALVSVYVGFMHFGAVGFGVLAGVAVFLVISWIAFAVTADVYLYGGGPCPGIVEALPKGVEFCAADHSRRANWLPPLFHFGQ